MRYSGKVIIKEAFTYLGRLTDSIIIVVQLRGNRIIGIIIPSSYMMSQVIVSTKIRVESELNC